MNLLVVILSNPSVMYACLGNNTSMTTSNIRKLVSW